jgi:hypothetical protein
MFQAMQGIFHRNEHYSLAQDSNELEIGTFSYCFFRKIIKSKADVKPTTMTTNHNESLSSSRDKPVSSVEPVGADVPNSIDDMNRTQCTQAKSSAGGSSFATAHESHDTDMMELTPYPYTTTSKEIEDWNQLEEAFGEDWSLLFADDLLSVEMSVDSDDEEDQSIHERAPNEYETNMSSEQEGENINAMRNLLWKQSLEPSLFAKAAT